MNSIIKKEKVKTKIFAEANGLSFAMIEDEIENIYNSLNPDDFESDDARKVRAIRRGRGAFKKQASQLKRAQDGVIVFRFRDYAFDRDQYNMAKSTEKRFGREQAIQKGFLNKEGEPIYQYGMNKGKVIEAPRANGSAVGYFCTIDKKTQKEVIKPKYFAISEKIVNDEIPVCQMSKIAGNIGKTANKNFPYTKDKMIWLNATSLDNDHKAPYSEEDLSVILTDFDKAFGDFVPKLTSFEELLDYGDECCNRNTKNDPHQFDFCFIPGVISEIGTPETEYDDIKVSIEFVDYETNETHYITMYLPKGQVKGLHMEEGSIGICALQAYSFNDHDDPRWHLGGFLCAKDDVDVEKFFGVEE